MIKKNERFDYSKLIERIKARYPTQDDFAEGLGIGRVSLKGNDCTVERYQIALCE